MVRATYGGQCVDSCMVGQADRRLRTVGKPEFTRVFELQTAATGNLGLAGSAQFAIPASAAAT